jgi:tRNA G18 (ribose-2'-O)-methylase SpoU
MMRGYFGIGVEGLSKSMNLGTLFRTAHAFGASFVFTVAAAPSLRKARLSDTSAAAKNLPYYPFESLAEFRLPKGCELVGVELTEETVELPSFRHPRMAAYVLGPERGSLSPELQEACAHVVKIPMAFCVNLGVAGAIVMYDRLLSMGRFGARPELPGGPAEPLPEPVFGEPVLRKKGRTGKGARKGA